MSDVGIAKPRDLGPNGKTEASALAQSFFQYDTMTAIVSCTSDFPYLRIPKLVTTVPVQRCLHTQQVQNSSGIQVRVLKAGVHSMEHVPTTANRNMKPMRPPEARRRVVSSPSARRLIVGRVASGTSAVQMACGAGFRTCGAAIRIFVIPAWKLSTAMMHREKKNLLALIIAFVIDLGDLSETHCGVKLKEFDEVVLFVYVLQSLP